jgi:hypothetical protein
MKTPITPEALIEMGFVEMEYSLVLYKPVIVYDKYKKTVFMGVHKTNATTIEDIKALIRLFK